MKNKSVDFIDHPILSKRFKVNVARDIAASLYVDTNVMSVSANHYFITNHTMNILGKWLHATMMYKYLRGDFGPLDKPVITFATVYEIWKQIIFEYNYGLGRVSTWFYCCREVDFWDLLIRNQLEPLGFQQESLPSPRV